MFNVLVGNMDSHAKNLSLITHGNKKTLAPFYDMVCTVVYPSLSQKFAFKVGGENRLAWLMLRHWERFANDIDTKPKLVLQIISEIMLRIEKLLPLVKEKIKKEAFDQAVNMAWSITLA